MLYNLIKHKVYIGETGDFSSRKAQHFANLKVGTHPNKGLQKDFDNGDEILFVVLEDMGISPDANKLIRQEKLYIAAFLDKYVKLYNKETAKSIKERLYFDIVAPQIYDAQNSLKKRFGSPVASWCYCGLKTIKQKLGERDNATK